jgi:peroxiredoxin
VSVAKLVAVGQAAPDFELTDVQERAIRLLDYRHTVANLYRQEVKLRKPGRMLTMVIVDKEGLIQFVHYGDDVAEIPKNEDVLALLERLNSAAEVSQNQP